MNKNNLLLLCLIFGCLSTYAQIGINENFDNGLPSGWTQTFGVADVAACEGESVRYNVHNQGDLTSPNIIGLSNQTDLTISFDYKIIQYSSSTAATPEVKVGGVLQ
ncbi:hypothetical protein [Mesonia aestuariivivens]|uniref:Uncharacterized protein n=1 Tax=Mesonia aestuariivivens TaxID=2796128 RepID=A0ABS6VZH2_9FLAO|nr:hypothetical protein [Mesonia aestuariivivens]MBW2960298.1 hypothetical protein [Mesonia aestuariivivens]